MRFFIIGYRQHLLPRYPCNIGYNGYGIFLRGNLAAMFINRTEMIIGNRVQLNYGAAVTDIDGDGHFEIIVTGYGFPNTVLKWMGDGLHDITPPELADFERMSIGVAAGDLDADGREEIYILNADTFGGRKRFGDRLH
jgi:FG-GAP-like repeat